MEDGVRFIFKTLIKIPVIIVISYLLFNLFSYTVAYFRLYSLSQMVTSIVMENNYLPGNDTDTASSGTLYGQVNQYVEDNLRSALLVNPDVTVSTKRNVHGASFGVNDRVQYGGEARVTVRADLVWLIPLVNIRGEYLNDTGVKGLSNNATGNVSNADSVREDRGFTNRVERDAAGNIVSNVNNYHPDTIGSHGAQTTIEFSYVVPCTKYYADLTE